MPAPLARGILFSISLLIAAGIAVYENPQVRQWIDENRRKLALALHGLGDDVHPGSLFGHDDVSLREDDSPEAAERRRVARAAILERARQIQETREASAPGLRRRGTSFDDMVDNDGKLRNGQVVGVTATGIETPSGKSAEQQLRNRSVEAAGIARGSSAANPFADEMVMSYNSGLTEDEALEQATRASHASAVSFDDELVAALAASVVAAEAAEAEAKAKANAEESEADAKTKAEAIRPSIETEETAVQHGDARSETSESEVLIDLTPTTSRAPSSFHPIATPRSTGTLSADASPARTPRSTRSTASATFESLGDDNLYAGRDDSASLDFQSIHEWAESSRASFYSPPESDFGTGDGAVFQAASSAPSSEHDMHDTAMIDAPSRSDSVTLGEGQTPGAVVEAENEPGDDDAMSEAEVVSITSSHLRAMDEADSLGIRTPGTWTEVGSVVSEDH